MAFKNPFEGPAKAVGQKIGDVASGYGQTKQAISDIFGGPVKIADRAKQMMGLQSMPPRRPSKRRR